MLPTCLVKLFVMLFKMLFWGNYFLTAAFGACIEKWLSSKFCIIPHRNPLDSIGFSN